MTNTIRIPKPGIFSFAECLHFLDRGYDDCLYSIDGARIYKPLRIGDRRLLIQVTEAQEALEVTLLAGEASQETRSEVADFVTDWFDLQRNLKPYYLLLKKDNRFSWMADRFYGLRLMGIPDLFEALCWCVIGQQINLTFAHRLKRKLVETYGTTLTYNARQHYYFPEPEVLADLKVKDLKDLQFSRQKAEYTIGIAREFAEEKINKHHLVKLKNGREMLKRLLKIRGVGEWTANYVLMKSLKRSHCITYGDTGLQSAVSTVLDLSRKPTRDEVEEVFKPFVNWESYLVIYLWRTLNA